MRPTPSERDFGFRFSRTDKTLKSLTSNQNQGGLLNFMVDSEWEKNERMALKNFYLLWNLISYERFNEHNLNASILIIDSVNFSQSSLNKNLT